MPRGRWGNASVAAGLCRMQNPPSEQKTGKVEKLQELQTFLEKITDTFFSKFWGLKKQFRCSLVNVLVDKLVDA